MDLNDYSFYTVPPTCVALASITLLIIQRIKPRKNYDEVPQEEALDIPIIVDDTRFSTVKRDLMKIGIIILQIGIFSFLFGYRYDQNRDDVVGISAGVLALCWCYALTITIIGICSKSNHLGWVLNAHLTAFTSVAFLCSFWQLRTAIKLEPVVDHRNHLAIKIDMIVAICNSIFSLIATSVAITTPKGPPLIQEGRAVNAIEYCSILDFITFSMATPLMVKAYSQKTFQDIDLDLLPFSCQSRVLHKVFKNTLGNNLLYRILKANKRTFAIQLFFTIVVSTLYYVPMVFLYKFLKILQDKPDHGLYEWGFIYICGMLITNILIYICAAQNWFWSSSILQVSIKGMLCSEILAKSLKRVDTHVMLPEDESDDQDASGKNEDEDKNDEGSSSIGRITNLMAVDTNRVSEFAVWWTSVIDSPVELAVGIYFLYQILGVSCLFGSLAMIFILPINHVTAKYYAKTQDNLMRARDHRVLQGIRMIKFFAWEKNWERRVLEARRTELKQLRYNFIYMTILDLLWMVSPTLVTIISFLFYTLVQGQQLTAAVAFTSITIFNELRYALNVLPEVLVEALQASISLKRIDKFLHEDEIDTSSENDVSSTTNSISFVKATVTWNKEKATGGEVDNVFNEFSMHDLNIDFPIGELSVICEYVNNSKNAKLYEYQTDYLNNQNLLGGPTGSGKTLLLLSLLGETNVLSGKIHCPRPPTDLTSKDINALNWILPNGVAYVAQQPWLQNASIRDNILFGLPYDETRYNQVIKVCALEKDLEIFEDKDMTEIGEKGITLSGGQKQRCALARAVYSRAKHIFVDDVFSAVDAHTAQHLMNECFLGPLMEGRTRILVTHHVGLCLSGASYLVVVNNGELKASGNISELKNSGTLVPILQEYNSRSGFQDFTVTAIEDAAPHSSITTKATIQIEDTQPKKNADPKILIEEESRPTGMVRLKIYATYFRANGHMLYWMIVAGLFVGSGGIRILESWWLKTWSDADIINSNHEPITTITFIKRFDWIILNGIFRDLDEPHSVEYYLNIYVIITFASVLFGISRFIWLYYGSLKASKKLYQKLLNQVIRAPLRFFDTTPVGRILNRFSKDFETIDSSLIEFIVAAIIFGAIFLLVGSIYAKASRELKRMDSVTRSPLYSHFTETLVGITTIRAFGATRRFMEEMLLKIDKNLRPFFYVWLVNRWLSILYNITGSFVTFLAGLFIMWDLEHIGAGLAGLSLSFAMNFTKQIMWSVRKYTSLEMSLNAVERVSEFSEIPQEPPAIIEPRPPANWPHSGSISVQNLEVKYASDSEPVLHRISFSVKGREKVGLVGRTGSGKSTIALSLFRFIEPSGGHISIDGIDISSIGVEDLRSRITIIPQDPILFSGTIRSNLDAFSQYDDHELLESLRRVHLISSASEIASGSSTTGDNVNVFTDLYTPVSEGGKNFSQGQRQLLCLARALLRRSKIIVMDEATASIDFSMDEKIQKMIRTEFEDCTIMCIAHRLRTVIDYDKILVLDNGNIVEFDSPYNLIANPESLFHMMCKNTGEFDLLMALALKKGKSDY
ncbi:16431_t:CDS:10 [Acaulospora morrowiae]|uniref:16431_t:CDS:1 n=1 Tax=Acaulospora morrowiae TaxID=94023 RepID=A0A9N8VTG3_9GLOM|nr:16431_t:CDS:10 [Acaulospora morrowiae]